MKIALLIALTYCFSFITNAQGSGVPEIRYESAFHALEIEFKAGDTIVFVQNCTDKSPKELVNHSVQFNKYYIKAILFRAVIFFEDTVVRKTVYHYTGKDMIGALSVLNLSYNSFQLYDKDLRFYTKQKGNVVVTCWIDKKKLYYTEELLKEFKN